MLIERLQKLPYNTRVKILWISFVVAAIGLVIIFTNSIRTTIKTSGGQLINLNPAITYPESSTKFASVEWVEQSGSDLKIYFNLNNTTNDILNAPDAREIKLKIDDKFVTATGITDRQGNPFVQKILSHTQNFGILRFTNASFTDADLIFGGMSLENEPTNIFQQTLKLNFQELNNPSNVRR